VRRLALALVTVLALGAPIVHLLRTAPDATPLERELFPYSPWAYQRLRPLPVAAGDGTPVVTAVTLGGGDVRLFRYSRFGLSFSTYGTAPRLVSGTVRVSGTPCAFRATADEPVPDGGILWFAADEGCRQPSPVPSGTLEVEVVLADRQPLGLWTVEVTQEPFLADLPRMGALRLEAEGAPVVRAFAEVPPAPVPARRATLLARMWGLADERAVWASLLLVAAVFTAALLSGGGAGREGATRVSRAWSPVLVSGLLAVSLAAAYAVLVPPLQAPDEPWHLLGFAAVTGDDTIPPALETWARRTHFERIRFREDQRFGAAHLLEPFPATWGPDGGPTPTASRSALAVLAYRALAPLTRGVPIERQLLRLRLAFAVLFGAAVALAAALLVAATERRGSLALAGLGPLIVPALPFFAMHVSETALLVAVYTVLAGAVAGWWHRGTSPPLVGLTLGVCSLGLLAGGRSAWPVLVVVAFVAAARLLDPWRGWARAVLYWGGLALPPAGFLLARPHDMLDATNQRVQLATVFGTVPLDVDYLWRSLVAGALVLLVLERLARGRIASVTAWSGWGAIARVAAAAGIVGIGASLAASLVVTFPRLPLVEPVPLPLEGAWTYARQTVAGMALTFRLTSPDPLLFSSFWTGFGWLDVRPASAFLVGLVVVLAGLVVRTLWLLPRRDPGPRLLRLGILALGLVASLWLYAFVLFGARISVHGRYLLGWWLLALAPVWLGALVAPEASPRRAWWPRVAVVGAGAAHIYCLSVILTRYF